MDYVLGKEKEEKKKEKKGEIGLSKEREKSRVITICKTCLASTYSA